MSIEQSKKSQPATHRLERQAGEVIDRSRSFAFTFNGRNYQAFEGDTIISALAAAELRVFSRSFKYHRPRGILTATFHDPGCLLQVGDEPNVRAAHRQVRAGMVVSSQNVWPSLTLDAGAMNQYLGRFTGAGFYYKTFMKPQRLWPAYERILQRFAPGGRVQAREPQRWYDKRYAHPDVVVAGGGPAGMAAAIAAADAGASVMLVEAEYQLGGHLRYGETEELRTLAGLRAQVEARPAIEVLVNSVVTGRYEQNWIAVIQRELPDITERLIKARAKALVVAPGLIERPYVFDGNDLPGVMLSGAVRRLINLYAVKPGERAVVVTANDEGLAAARDLKRAGVEVVRVVDMRDGVGLLRASGRGGVRQVELADHSRIDCDLLVTATGWTAPTSLLNMAGDVPRYDERAARFVPGSDLPEDVFVTGGLLGDGPIYALLAHGQAVGTAAARWAKGLSGTERFPTLEPAPHAALFRAATHGIVDFSEDVSSKDIVTAAEEGYDSVELAKRYTTATMGPSQGKLETVNTVAVLAEATRRGIGETGTTVWRPPYVPISLGALAGRLQEPIRYSPMQSWHEAHGASPLVAGQWIRPEHYGDPLGEVRNVRRRVGIIDVTPLGKLDLQGPDVPKLLNFLYINKWSRLDVGSVRYGVMCGEDGVVIDDGVTGRLGPEHYFMSTTSSGATATYEWIENWLQGPFSSWRVHVTPVLAAYASVNVAGPNSRALLERLVDDVDLSPEAFGYMRVRTGTIAGVPGCHIWRIGFTGELSFEIHVPAGYGLFVWERLMAEGADLGVAPFGVEAQRIMRLEKGHLIVGQDTDGSTLAAAAGLEGLVKLDKEDFAGKPELAWEQGNGHSLRLVALRPADPQLVPPEASLIVGAGSAIEGRVTSSRYSPTLERSICLGLVSQRLAQPGTSLTVRLPDGGLAPVTVLDHLAQFDPEGTRLRG